MLSPKPTQRRPAAPSGAGARFRTLSRMFNGGRAWPLLAGSGCFATVAAALLAVCAPAPADAAVGPTVQDLVEFTRIIQPVNLDDETLQMQRSPGGQQLFIVTRKSVVASDVNQYDILLLDVSARVLDTGRAQPPQPVLRVHARRDNNDAVPSLTNVRWIDDRTLVMRARMNDPPFQAYKLDTLTRRLTPLTFAPNGVVAFDVSDDLQRVVYVSPVPNPPAPAGARAIVAGTISFWSLHFGHEDLGSQQRRYQYYTVAAGARGQEQTLGEPFAEANLRPPPVSISPDGRWALLPKLEPERHRDWSKQYPFIAQSSAQFGAALTMDPQSYFTRPSSYVTRRLVAYRLSDRQLHTIVDAPDDAVADTQARAPGVWVNGGRSVVIAGTFLPRETGSGDPGSASHVIEYWPDSGQWKDIAALQGRAKGAFSAPGPGEGVIVIDGDRHRRFVRDRAGDGWLEEAALHSNAVAPGVAPSTGAVPTSGAASASGATPVGVTAATKPTASAAASVAQPAAPHDAESSTWRVQVRQSLNQPPDIQASAPGKATVRLTELNPQFKPASWGSMRPYAWRDVSGRTWQGGLMVPADFDPAKRHATVIQSYGFSPDRFYRDGSNIYDGYTSGFAGRAFLRENILVLALPLAPNGGMPEDVREQRVAFVQGVRGAIDALAAQGIVDRDRVGLMGWSGTGELVLNLVTFSDVPIRAASLLDGDANTLFSLTITNAATDSLLMKKERANGGGLYGPWRKNWLANDPSLHTDCIRAAIRVEAYGTTVHNNWDIYALLRRQYKPAEMILLPEGEHALGRPADRMISLQGNVDWYKFWLNGEKRTVPLVAGETVASLAQQYARWEPMRTFKQLGDTGPVCTDDRLQ